MLISKVMTDFSELPALYHPHHSLHIFVVAFRVVVLVKTLPEDEGYALIYVGSQ